MPRGKGTYGKQVGRPSTKKKKLNKYQTRGENTGSFFGKVSDMAKRALQKKQEDNAKKKAAIMSATGQFDSGSDNLMELEMLAGKTLDGTIVDSFKGKRGIIEDSDFRKGGSVIDGKKLRGTRSYKR